MDAHHILERRLWPDGGYYLANGAAVCEEHHLAAEQTTLSCDDLRRHSGIDRALLPPHLDPDATWDKWGNQVSGDGTRSAGELFWDPSVQKILGAGGVLGLFDTRVRYPRTPHLRTSPGASADDVAARADLTGLEVVATVKLDGEATTMYPDGYCHARSTTANPHPSRSWVRALAARVGPELPAGWRLCGENLYARHSIAYDDLVSWFYGYNLWDGDRCLDWASTLEWFELLEIEPVPEFYRGPFDEDRIVAAWRERFDPGRCEGFVVRTTGTFTLAEFARNVAKWVRPGHVVTDQHWMYSPVVPNGLAP